MNTFLHDNGVVTGEVTIRMVSNTDKVLETRSGVKNRSVINVPYSKKLWRGKNFGEFGESQQFAHFFANFHFSACAVTR